MNIVMPKEILFILFLVLLDFAAILVITAHGYDWNSLRSHLQDKYVATTSLDFLCLTVLRASILLGALFGLLRNSVDGRTRLSKLSSNSYVFAVCVVTYLCVKLLIYSEEDTFGLGDPDFKWFWMNFASSIVLTVVDLYFIRKLANAQNHQPVVEVPSENDVVHERSPLLQQGSTEEVISINGETRPTPPSNKDSKKKDEKDSKKKTFTELANKVTIGKMLSYSKQDIWLIIPAVFFLLAAAVAETFIPLFTGRVISGIAIEKDYAAFTKNIIIMGVITIAAAVFAGSRGGLLLVAIARFNIRIRNHLFRALSRQDISFYDATKTGDILSRLTSDTSTMSDMIGLNCNIFLRSIVKGIGTCVFMFLLSWRLSVGTFLGLPLVVGLSKLYGSYYKKLQKQVQDTFASANEVAEEVVSTMRTVRSFANENGERERYKQKMEEVYSVKKKQALAYAGYLSSTEIAELALITGTLWYGGHLVMNDFMQSQNLISFILYQLTLGDCMSNIGSVYTGLMQALGASEKVFELIERKPEINLDAGDLKPDTFTGHVQFDNVSFSYPSRPDQPVLNNLSFIALPGQVTALVGPSGGGKTTCVNLLQYFYQTGAGAVRIDGLPIEHFSHKYIHQKVSLVGQEPVLYARSIRENIVYGLEESQFHDTDIVEAARKSNAHTFITSLADQYETECGEKGTQLSGGQKQRIAIARALIRDPRILILDEATSALDTESEFLVQQALQQTMKDRTVIVIAHRLSTVESADKIVVIDKGCVIEEGTHSELMKQSGMYYKLVHRQLHKHEANQNSEEDELSGSSSSSEHNRHIPIKAESPPNVGFLSSIASSFNSEKSVIYDSDEMSDRIVSV